MPDSLNMDSPANHVNVKIDILKPTVEVLYDAVMMKTEEQISMSSPKVSKYL